MSLINDILASALPGPLKAAFGDSVQYKHLPAATTQTVTAIPSDPLTPEPVYPGKLTTIDVLFADLSPAPRNGDEVTISSTAYKVIDVNSDTIGPTGLFARISLQKK